MATMAAMVFGIVLGLLIIMIGMSAVWIVAMAFRRILRGRNG